MIARRLVLLSAVLIACSQEGRYLGEGLQPIAGGVPDGTDTAVVGIYVNTNGATCTGSLIAPNLVLTGRHCVAQLPQPIDCMAAFGSTTPASEIYVTTQPNIWTAQPSDFYPGASVVVEPGPGLVCGDDVALIVLAENIPEGEATPLVPRVDEPAAVGEVYAAVGYGATSDFGTDGGERRRRDDLVVECLGAACGTWAAATEWSGNEGVCPGDSGGPALDEQGRVFGVVSRGSVGCVSPVYGDVAAHADWLKAEGIDAAAMGGYPTPPWALGEPTGMGGGGGAGGSATSSSATTGSATTSSSTTAPSGATTAPGATSGAGGAASDDDESNEEDGCRLAAAADTSFGAPGLALLVLAARCLRRRRRAPARV